MKEGVSTSHFRAGVSALRRCAGIGLSLVFCCCTGYQPKSLYEESLNRSSGPDFSFQALSYRGEEKKRTDVYVGLSNNALQFTREGGQYVASYSISLRVVPTDRLEIAEGPLERERIAAVVSWTETVTESSYEETVARAYHVSPRTVPLDPGLYTILAEVTDEVSKRTLQKRKLLEVPDFSMSFLGISNVTVGSRFVMREGKGTLVPDVIPEMSTTGQPTYAQFEIYDRFPGREITLNYKLYTARRYTTPSFLSRYHRTEEVKLRPDTLVWSRDSSFTTRSSVVPVTALLPELPPGHYRIEVIVRAVNGVGIGGQRASKAVQIFSLWPIGFPELVTLDQQIEVLEYIATPEEFDTLQQARTKDEKERLLKAFWSTRSNRDEYYKRAEYANRYFTCLHQGWRTQFGWAYIVVGPPEDVQLTPRGGERWRYTYRTNRLLTLPFVIREFSFPDGKCRYGAVYIEPGIRRDLVLQWRKPG